MRYVKHFVTDQSPQTQIFRWVLISVMIAAVVLSLSMPALAQTKYVITDGENVIVCMSNSSDPKVVIREAGLQLGESDTYTTLSSDGISEIHINRIQMITVREGEETYVVGSYGGTVADVLASLNITLTDGDTLSCSPSDKTYDGMEIRLSRSIDHILEYEEVIPHHIDFYEDDTLEPGQELTLVEGADGLKKIRAQIHYKNGVETHRDILSEQTVTEPVNGIVLRGVDRSVKTQENSGSLDYVPADTSQKGQNDRKIIPGTSIEYHEVLDFKATAYFSPNPLLWNTTYTGTEAKVGTIAVDPNFIPLGSKMYVVSADGEYVYGYGVAEDIGGAIKGKLVDLYFRTYDECIAFGRRDVKIYILEYGT